MNIVPFVPAMPVSGLRGLGHFPVGLLAHGAALEDHPEVTIDPECRVCPVLDVPQFAHITLLHELLLLPTCFSGTIYSTDYYL